MSILLSKKMVCLFIGICIFIIIFPCNVMADVDLSKIVEIGDQVMSGNNVKAWKNLTSEMIEEAFKSNDQQYVISAAQSLGYNLGSESYYITSKEDAELYISLANKFKEEWNDEDNLTIVTGIQTTNYEFHQYLDYMEILITYATKTDFPEENDGNKNNNDNDNKNDDNEPVKVDNDTIFELEWDKIQPDVYGGQGLSVLDDAKKLYNKLMEVHYEDLSDEDKEKWDERAYALIRTLRNEYATGISEEMASSLESVLADDPIYTNPLTDPDVKNRVQTSTSVTPNTIIADSEQFIKDGKDSNIATINQENADTVLNSIYNIMLAIGITVTVIWGLIIAIKLMMSSVEEKAEYKKLLWPYLVGCIVIFGSFIIWKIVIIIMNGVM